MYLIPIIISLLLLVSLFQKNLAKYIVYNKHSYQLRKDSYSLTNHHLLIYIIFAIILIIMAYLFSLKPGFIIILLFQVLLFAPIIMIAIAKRKFLENEFHKIHDFLNYFILSFKQNQVMFTALTEARPYAAKEVQKLVDQTLSKLAKGVDSQSALSDFLKEQNHFIIINLMNYCLNVEQFGTDFAAITIEDLQKDLDEWFEDVILYQEQLKKISFNIRLFILFAVLICFMAKNMLVEVGLSLSNILYQNAIFVFSTLLVITVVISYLMIAQPWIEAKECI